MMAGADEAWREVGNRFSSLGRSLRDRYQQAAAGGEGPEPRERAQEGRERAQEGMEEALRGVTEAVDRAATSLGETLRDPDVREEALGAARSLADALSATFAGARGEVRERFGTGRGEQSEPPPPPSPPPQGS